MGIFFAFPNVKEDSESIEKAPEDQENRASGAD